MLHPPWLVDSTIIHQSICIINKISNMTLKLRTFTLCIWYVTIIFINVIIMQHDTYVLNVSNYKWLNTSTSSWTGIDSWFLPTFENLESLCNTFVTLYENYCSKIGFGTIKYIFYLNWLCWPYPACTKIDTIKIIKFYKTNFIDENE